MRGRVRLVRGTRVRELISPVVSLVVILLGNVGGCVIAFKRWSSEKQK